LKTILKFGTEERISTALGLEITRNRQERTMEINCGAKIRGFLAKYNLHDRIKPKETPYLPRKMMKEVHKKYEGPTLEKTEVPCLSMLMTIAWIAQHCRIELIFILSVLRQYQQNPGPAHYQALVRCAQYLKKYPDLTLKIGGCKSFLEVVYDASFANLEDGSSTGACVIRMFGTPIVVWASKLKLKEHGKTPTSTTKAEVKTAVVAAERLDEVLNYLRETQLDKVLDSRMKTQRYNGAAEDKLPALDCDVHVGLKNIPFYGDNKAVIGALDGTQKADALRSITWGTDLPTGSHKAGIAFLRDSCDNNDIMPAYITDVENSIDVLTKPKDGPTFHAHSRILRGHAELNFTKTIEVLEKAHIARTTKKPFKWKQNYDSDKLNVMIPESASIDVFGH